MDVECWPQTLWNGVKFDLLMDLGPEMSILGVRPSKYHQVRQEMGLCLVLGFVSGSFQGRRSEIQILGRIVSHGGGNFCDQRPAIFATRLVASGIRARKFSPASRLQQLAASRSIRPS